MSDYRNTKYSLPFANIYQKKKDLEKQIKTDHPKARNMYRFVSNRSYVYKTNFIEIYNFKCGYCGISIDLIPSSSFQVDHFINKESKRFKDKCVANNMDNLVCACNICNLNKRDFEIPLELEKILLPDSDEITNVFYRDELFNICISEKYKDNEYVVAFYKKLKLNSEIHRLNYLLMSMTGLNDKLKKKGKRCISLSNAIDILKRKRNYLS